MRKVLNMLRQTVVVGITFFCEFEIVYNLVELIAELITKWSANRYAVLCTAKILGAAAFMALVIYANRDAVFASKKQKKEQS